MRTGCRNLSGVSSTTMPVMRKFDVARNTMRVRDDAGEYLQTGLSPSAKLEAQNGSGLLSSISQFIAGDKETQRSGFGGEHHALLKLKHGVGRANYMGPGTNLSARLKRGDPPRTLEDKVAQAHDIRYGLAKNQAEVSNADRKMIAKLQNMKKMKQGNRFNIELGLRPIQAKLAMESRGMIKPGRIASFGDLKDGASRDIAMTKINELEQEGYGRPAEMLRKRLLSKVSRAKLQKARTGKGTRKNKRGRGLSLPGGGLILPGGGVISDVKKTVRNLDKKKLAKQLSVFVLKQLVPLLLQKLQSGTGLKLAGQGAMNNKIKSLVEMRILKRLNDGASRDGFDIVGTGIMPSKKKIKDMSKDVAKMLLPILITAVASSANKKIKGMGGGANRILTQKDFDNFKPSLTNKLTTGVLKSLFHFFKKQAGYGCGSGMSGQGFFGDFVKGFRKGFMAVANPAMKVAKFIAPLAPLLL